MSQIKFMVSMGTYEKKILFISLVLQDLKVVQMISASQMIFSFKL